MSSDGSLSKKEDKLKHQYICDKEDVKEYCETFYAMHDDFTFRPFIAGDIGQTMAKMPPWYKDYQDKLVKNYNKPETDYDGDDTEEAAKPAQEIDEKDMNELVKTIKLDENEE